jgi:hypothetical protein
MGGRKWADGEMSAISLVMHSLHNIGRKVKGHIYSSTSSVFYASFDKCVDPVLTSRTRVEAAAFVPTSI